MKKRWVWGVNTWFGMECFGWWRLLASNRFAIDLPFLPLVLFISLSALWNTFLNSLQTLLWGRRLQKTAIVQPPLFVLGHWRSGTTLLHELLSLDPRHTFPTTYECIFPGHFLLTKALYTRLFRFLLPTRRPMDNMSMGWDRPQEDEFALCNLGLPSPYLTTAFPNHPPQCLEYFDLETLSPEELERWKHGFLRFLKSITLQHPHQRIVLKSPTHSYRIKVLLELFPEAQFVHIVRNPYVVIPSYINTYKSLARMQALQHPIFDGSRQDYLFDRYSHLYEKLEEGRALVKDTHFYEIRYEDLVQNPRAQLQTLYEHLHLGNFDQVLPGLEQYLANTAGYKTNRYELPPELRAKITQRCGHIISRYGYDCESEIDYTRA